MESHYSDERGRFPTSLIAIVVVALAVVIVLVLALFYFSGNSYYPYSGGYMGGFMGSSMIMFPIVIIVIVIIGLVVYRGVGWGGCCGGHPGHYGSDEEKETALEILRRRYAKGEITKEQFEQMKKDLLG